MYLEFYAFREKPFNLTPDPRFVFLSKNHKEAFAHILYGINNRAGFIALTGEVGSGKTTVLRALLSQLNTDHHRTALIFNPCLSSPELLQNINREFGIPSGTPGNASPLDALNQFLLQQNAEGRTVVLVIDEAQNLEPPVLEQVRLISNLETDREKLIQIVLSGQPEFAQILKKKEMRQLSQRITVRYHLQPMDFEDTVDYIHHRLEVAGGRGGVNFSKGALKQIYRYSRGLPRLINAVCDRALLAGYTKDTSRISSRIAAAGVKDMKKDPASYPGKRRLILIPALALLAAVLVVAIYYTYTGRDLISQFQEARNVQATQGQAKPKEQTKIEEQTKTKETMKKEPAATEEKTYRDMAVELGKVTERESARLAFNALAALWKVPSVPESADISHFKKMERAALERDLRLYRFSGNLGALLRIDCPAMLELNLSGIPGKRLVALVGMEKEQLLIAPPIAGWKSLPIAELEKHWSGQGFLLWKDPLNLLARVSPRSKGSNLKKLQGLLKEAGAYSRPLTGVYDNDTILAVKAFQSARGIEQDGIVGGQTLMLLYRSIDHFGVPRLTAGLK